VIRKPAFDAVKSLVRLPGFRYRSRAEKKDWQCKVSLQFLRIDNPIAPACQDRAVCAGSMAGLILIFENRLPSNDSRRDEKISVQRPPAPYKESSLRRYELYSPLSNFFREARKTLFPNEHCIRIRRKETSG